MEVPVIICILILLAALTRVLTVFIHELGHAIAGLILLNGDISIYVGSYGDPKKGIHFKVGRLNVHFKYNPLLWNHGLCTSNSSHMSFTQGYIFTLAGPLASLLVAISSALLLANPELHGSIKLISIFLLFSSIPDFFQNISPNKNPIFLHDGTMTYNDGQSLKLLREYRNVYKEITLLSQYYRNDELEKGIMFFEEVHAKTPDINILRMGVALYLRNGEYEKVKALYVKMSLEQDLNSDDYCNYALAYSHSGQHLNALNFYEKSLNLNPESFYSLNNRGYTLNILERYDQAINDFNKAIDLNPHFAYAYNNRGLSKIKLGQVEDGLADIEKSMEIDIKNSYAYKNLGIYHKDKGEYAKAMKYFEEAKNYDPKTDGLSELIAETEIEMKDL